MSKKIENIEIKYIKGIEQKKINLGLIPNKVSILVAPNGFGKSSIAVAFQSLKNSNLKLDPKNEFRGENHDKPELILTYDGVEYTNQEIKNEFNVHVINGRLQAKPAGKMNGVSLGANIKVEPIILCSKIPKKTEFNYNISQIKKIFGENKKILSNIKNDLNNIKFLECLLNIIKSKLNRPGFNKKLQNVINKINKKSGTAEQIKKQIIEDSQLIDEFDNIHEEFNKIIELIKQYTKLKNADVYLSAYQIVQILKNSENNIKNIHKYEKYKKSRDGYKKLVNYLYNGNIKIVPKEIKSKLIIEFPNANLISNGERDCLSFALELERIRQLNDNKKTILIIDEVFDYLDSANLIAVQYYLSNFINQYKEKEIYPIILTHLDPEVFSHYVIQKPQVKYLNRNNSKKSDRYYALVKKRNEKCLKGILDKYFLHYHNKSQELPKIKEKFNKNWYNSASFYTCLEKNMECYINDNEYHPFGIAIGLRVMIERYLYNKLDLSDQQDQQDFLVTWKTKEKIKFCEEKGIDVPEIFSMLGILYNDNLHCNKDNYDYETSLQDKLSNLVIRQMIKVVYDMTKLNNEKTTSTQHKSPN